MQWFFMGLDGPIGQSRGVLARPFLLQGIPWWRRRVWGSREMFWLGGEDKKDGVSCRRANLTSRHIAGCVNTGGTMNYENEKFKHQRSGRPSLYLPGIPWASWLQSRGDVRGWDLCRGLLTSISLRLLTRAGPYHQQ